MTIRDILLSRFLAFPGQEMVLLSVAAVFSPYVYASYRLVAGTETPDLAIQRGGLHEIEWRIVGDT